MADDVTKKSAVLSPATQQRIDQWLWRYPAEQRRSAILPALHIVQEENQGWLTTELLQAVADYLQIPHTAAYEVATFYALYRLQPPGKHVIAFCRNIACMLNGADVLFAYLEQRLGITSGETTADGCFTLQEAECLGACIKAPVCQIGKQYYEQLTPKKLAAVLDQLSKNE